MRPKALMDDTSIAIWNRDKVIVAISIVVWLVNLSFLIQGELPRLRLLEI